MKIRLICMALMALFTQLASAQLTINIRYSGENGAL